MSKNRKRATTVAAAGAVIAIAIGGGVAWAAFNRATTANAAGNSETFKPLTVAGTIVLDTGTTGLLPGENANVNIKVTTPAGSTVNGKIKSVTPKTVVAGDIGGIVETDKAACAGWLGLKTYVPTANAVIAKTAGDVNVLLTDAVTLHTDATEICSGMTFTTKWDVVFEATREDATPTAIVLTTP
ncbi:hypothetical protein [Catenuloplanes japonicus]|uniref:hypothetical protein n=1 Tax=Catenuloplanes japonicus TaxID=33876 RepID=UPI0012F7B0E9|nr:hypothetical protein [Catenuloplanes japonicus]